jgi:hypothetical protein
MINSGGNPDPKGVLDDLLSWFRYSDGLHVLVWVNSGNGDFQKEQARALIPFDCPSEDVRWADVSSHILLERFNVLTLRLPFANTYFPGQWYASTPI